MAPDLVPGRRCKLHDDEVIRAHDGQLMVWSEHHVEGLGGIEAVAGDAGEGALPPARRPRDEHDAGHDQEH